MGQQITLTGIILAATSVGDFDKRLVILSKERGKITVFAKGARRQNSPHMAVCQPFSFGQFTLYEGRSAYNLHSADITNYFTELKNDLQGVTYGMYFCEFADYLTREFSDDYAILKLLYQSLRALSNESIPDELIRYIYEIKVLAYHGQGMQTFHCASCGKETELKAFDSYTGGAICIDCSKNMGKTISISESTLYTLQYILSSPVEKLYTFLVSKQVLKELSCITKQYIAVYVDKKFKSLDFMLLL